MPITSVKQARFREEQELLSEGIKKLKEAIRENIRTRKEEGGELNDFYAREYEKLLELPLNNDADLEYVSWLYNYGDLRTDNEIYVHSGEFQSDCNKRSYGIPYALFFGGWLIVLILFTAWLYDGSEPSLICGLIGGTVLGGGLGGILCLIGGVAGEAINKSEADRMLGEGIGEAKPMAKRARMHLGVSAAGGAIAAASVGRHAHKAVKDICNVDGWKQMK